MPLSALCLVAARTVWFTFHLGCHRSAVSLSVLHVSPLTQTIAPMWDPTPASIPSPTKGKPSPTRTPIFSPNSFLLLSFAWFYIFFSATQVLLSALSCCSAYTSVWRCIPDVSTSTYSSTILFSQQFFFFLLVGWLVFKCQVLASSTELFTV